MGLSYNMNIDMWSLGCILAELFTGHPLFPGDNEVDLLMRVIEMFGNPPKEMAKGSTSKQLIFGLPSLPFFFEILFYFNIFHSLDVDARGNLTVSPPEKAKTRIPESKTLKDALKTEDEEFLDFVSRCLSWSPETRMNPDEALLHPWLAKVYEGPALVDKAIPTPESSEHDSDAEPQN